MNSCGKKTDYTLEAILFDVIRNFIQKEICKKSFLIIVFIFSWLDFGLILWLIVLWVIRSMFSIEFGNIPGNDKAYIFVVSMIITLCVMMAATKSIMKLWVNRNRSLIIAGPGEIRFHATVTDYTTATLFILQVIEKYYISLLVGLVISVIFELMMLKVFFSNQLMLMGNSIAEPIQYLNYLKTVIFSAKIAFPFIVAIVTSIAYYPLTRKLRG